MMKSASRSKKKIPLFCSFIPREILHFLDFELDDITPREDVTVGSEYSCVLHDNLCSYARFLFNEITQKKDSYSRIVVPNSCDALKKLYSSLEFTVSSDRLFFIDIPRSVSSHAINHLARQFESIIERFCQSPNQDPGKLRESVEFINRKRRENFEEYGSRDTDGPGVGIIGSVYPIEHFRKIIARFGAQSVILKHCGFGPVPWDTGDLDPNAGIHDICLWLAKKYLVESVCPRSECGKFAAYFSDIAKERNLRGLIVPSLKFCDFYAFEVERLKSMLPDGFPIMLLENDLTVGFDEQNRTRIEAFLESIFADGDKERGAEMNNSDLSPYYYAGVDIGSTMSKAVLIDTQGKILHCSLRDTSTNMKRTVSNIISDLLQGAEKVDSEIGSSVYTGYGRNALGQLNQVTEISCNGKGVNLLFEGAATIIDVGGQDSKAIRIDDRGNVVRFSMNDKCAAGTGRFIEGIVRKLDLSYESFNTAALKAKNATSISSMCSVFAESEVISLLAQGHSVESIASGIFASIARRVAGLVRKINGSPPYVMTGGVSRNAGFVRELERELGAQVTVLDLAQYAGAIGAALFARERGVDPEEGETNNE